MLCDWEGNCGLTESNGNWISYVTDCLDTRMSSDPDDHIEFGMVNYIYTCVCFNSISTIYGNAITKTGRLQALRV